MTRNAPDEFVERLHREFDGRLRIRWSILNGEWHIEQKIGRAALPPFRVSEADDSLIRARDGYWFVCAIRPGDRMPCPKCGLTLKVPVMEFRETCCEPCKRARRDGRTTAAYFPLGDRLLEHLRYIDTERDGLERQRTASDAANDALRKSGERQTANTVEAVTKENYTTLAEIESVGYTGKEFKG